MSSVAWLDGLIPTEYFDSRPEHSLISFSSVPVNTMATDILKLIHEATNKANKGMIPFAEFMDLVLYHPQYGYYGSGQVAIGAEGDFFTTSSLGADFGELLAEQLIQMQDILQLQTFQFVEMGAGNGQLARDILGYLQTHYPETLGRFEYLIVERSPALQQQQQQYLQEFSEANIRWSTWAEMPEQSIQGCCFSNELLDAFPVHLVTVVQGELKEIFVTTDLESEQGIKEVIAEPSTPRLAAYFANLGIDWQDYPHGYRTEVNLHALDWLATVQSRLKQGYLCTIDYGYPAAKYYHPQRLQGTLQAYAQHRRHNNPYANLGQQDLTAHVDFTSLQLWGESLGLATLGLTQQGLFLMALGLGDRLNALSTQERDVMQLFRRRDALHQLIDPNGLGGFWVLVQAQGLTPAQQQISLRGLNYPQ